MEKLYVPNKLLSIDECYLALEKFLNDTESIKDDLGIKINDSDTKYIRRYTNQLFGFEIDPNQFDAVAVCKMMLNLRSIIEQITIETNIKDSLQFLYCIINHRSTLLTPLGHKIKLFLKLDI
jgi:hypothetical protein